MRDSIRAVRIRFFVLALVTMIAKPVCSSEQQESPTLAIARVTFATLLAQSGRPDVLTLCQRRPCQSPCGEVHIAHACRQGGARGGVFLSPEAFQACKSFGAKATACFALIFGHEQAHLSLGHPWWIDQNFDSGPQQVGLEQQANEFGFSAAVLAGYDINRDGKAFLEALYKETGANQKAKSAQLQALVKNANGWRTMDQKYQAANVLFGLGQYLPAAALYSDVVDLAGGYGVPAAVNSAAVSLLFSAVESYPDIRRLPFVESGISALTVYEPEAGLKKGPEEHKKALILAEQELQMLVPKQFPPASINLALVHTLMPEWAPHLLLDRSRLQTLSVDQKQYQELASLVLSLTQRESDSAILKTLGRLGPRLEPYRDAWLTPPGTQAASGQGSPIRLGSASSVPVLTRIGDIEVPEDGSGMDQVAVQPNDVTNELLQSPNDIRLALGTDGGLLRGRAVFDNRRLYFLIARSWSGGEALDREGRASCLKIGVNEDSLACLGKPRQTWLSYLGEGRFYEEAKSVVWLSDGKVAQFCIYRWRQ